MPPRTAAALITYRSPHHYTYTLSSLDILPHEPPDLNQKTHSTTMSEQNKPYLDRALMVETLGKLAEQLALCEEDPNIQTTKALVATQAELSDLKNEVACMKQMIQSLRSLYSPPYTYRTQKLLIANIWHMSKSDRTEHMIPEPVPVETLSEATRKIMQEHPISWSSVGTMDSM